MKVVTPQEMTRIEQLAYSKGASEKAFMEAAGRGIFEVVEAFVNGHELPQMVYLLCGKGNNSGDAYVVGSLLLEKGYSVEAVQVSSISESSSLCQEMAARFRSLGGTIHSSLVAFDSGTIVDGLFGTGFKGEAKGEFAAAIDHANESKLPIIAIDIPSGLNGENGVAIGSAIQATVTVYLGLPKRGFFIEDGPNHTGRLIGRSFGLDKRFIDQAKGCGELLERADMQPLLPKITPGRHKYEAGHLLLIAGSPGMAGAALLCGSAALRSGTGVVRLMHPSGMESELSSSPYELIRHAYETPEELSSWVEKADAIVVGPGIGRNTKQVELLTFLFRSAKQPLLIDADALSLIAEEKLQPPKGSLLTPHAGEMKRLLNGAEPTNENVARYAKEHEVTLLLKGRATHIFSGEEGPWISTWGDPGMATAGTGDVLSGILGSLLAQGTTPLAAAQLGCYLHGRSGEIAAAERTSYGMIASDLIEWLPEAIEQLDPSM